MKLLPLDPYKMTQVEVNIQSCTATLTSYSCTAHVLE